MSRVNRVDVGGEVYHVLNRANARLKIFEKETDYQLFEHTLTEAKEKFDMRILAYTVMSNHWHLVLYPRENGDLSHFMSWVTMTHTQRYHAAHKSIGSGHLYQGRYKSFLIQKNAHLFQVIAYVERNPLRTKLVRRSEQWRWGSLWRRKKGSKREKKLLSSLPINLPSNYLSVVNRVESKEELLFLHQNIEKSKPLGKEVWVDRIVKKFHLEATLRNPGRPKKGS